MSHDTILDCYTDEPSGLGIPPYLGVHQRYIAGSLSLQGRVCKYVTIDDVRHAHGENDSCLRSNIRIRHLTRNHSYCRGLLSDSDTVYVVMGSFVRYKYLSAEPPGFDELRRYLSEVQSRKVLVYALGGATLSPDLLERCVPQGVFSDIVCGNVHNYMLHGEPDSFAPNYDYVDEITTQPTELLEQIPYPVIAEIETATGCNRRPGCSFCIESIRGLPLESRKVDGIVEEVAHLYASGVRHFRLGRQPNFYAYMGSDPCKVEELLSRIRDRCPDLEMLHIDNVGPQDVVTPEGRSITKHIVKYCTPGNIAPFGVESFDEQVRSKNNLNGFTSDIMDAISILNDCGAERGSNGVPLFLPGINLIYNLPGQTGSTLKRNLDQLKSILQRGDLVRRTFVRPLTSPHGAVFDSTGNDDPDSGLAIWQASVSEEFEKPMLRRVFPIGTVLSGLRSEVWNGEATICRQLATCPVRVTLPGCRLPLDRVCDARVTAYVDSRTLSGEVV